MKVLEFRKISKSFGPKKVLDSLNFSLEEGEIYGLLGPNGCGKTTATNILSNLLNQDDGTVEINGQPHSLAGGKLLGVCPQEISLYKDLRPSENLRFFAGLYGLKGKAAESRIGELMDLFNLNQFKKTPISRLSGGWQRRVNIAGALIHNPKICVLDEPTAALDIESRHELWQIIKELKSRKISILLTTHHLDEAERLCDTVGIMSGGKILKEGPVPDLISLVPGKMIALVESPTPEILLKALKEIGWEHRVYASRIGALLPSHYSLKEVMDQLNGVELTSLSMQPIRLEHAYLEILGQNNVSTM